MDRQAVLSSNIHSIGWKDDVLEVEFKNGSVYQYYDVQFHVYQGLMGASSHGEFLDRNIKKAGYRYVRVR